VGSQFLMMSHVTCLLCDELDELHPRIRTVDASNAFISFCRIPFIITIVECRRTR